MAKISQYPDGGAIQATDQIVIARAGANYSILPGGLFQLSSGNWNSLPNGGMRVAQRGAGPFTSATSFPNNDDVYLIDGTILLSDGNDIVDVSRVADTDFVSGYKIRLDVETANKRFGIFIPVETRDIQEIRKAGKASLQFKAKCTGASMSNVRAYLLAWSSTADTITSDCISAWGAAGNNPTFVANWTAENSASNIAITTSIATNKIENITVDTASVANLGVLIIVDDTDATVGDYLEIGDVKLEAGAFCTVYQNDDIATEIERCRRYVQKSFQTETAPADAVFSARYAGFAPSTTEINVPIPISTPMVKAPTTFIFYRSSQGASAGNWAFFNGSYTDASATILSDSAVAGDMFCIGLSVVGATAYAAYICKGGWFASAEL